MKILIITIFVGSRLREKVTTAAAEPAADNHPENQLEEFSSSVLCENYGVWRWSILLRFWRILGFWFLGCRYACPCQFGTDLALIEYWSSSELMKLSDPPFDFVIKLLILPPPQICHS